MTAKDVEADAARFRRSNLGGDDLPTKIVFVLIVMAGLAWVVRVWIAGHSGTSAWHP